MSVKNEKILNSTLNQYYKNGYKILQTNLGNFSSFNRRSILMQHLQPDNQDYYSQEQAQINIEQHYPSNFYINTNHQTINDADIQYLIKKEVEKQMLPLKRRITMLEHTVAQSKAVNNPKQTYQMAFQNYLKLIPDNDNNANNRIRKSASTNNYYSAKFNKVLQINVDNNQKDLISYNNQKSRQSSLLNNRIKQMIQIIKNKRSQKRKQYHQPQKSRLVDLIQTVIRENSMTVGGICKTIGLSSINYQEWAKERNYFKK